MIQLFKHIFQWSLTFVAPVYAPKKYILTRKMYVSIKVYNISGDSKFRAMCLK